MIAIRGKWKTRFYKEVESRVYIRPTFLYFLFYGNFFLKIESGGRNKNKNKIFKFKQSVRKIKIK